MTDYKFRDMEESGLIRELDGSLFYKGKVMRCSRILGDIKIFSQRQGPSPKSIIRVAYHTNNNKICWFGNEVSFCRIYRIIEENAHIM